MKARFIGTDSLGYKNGRVYDLIVKFDHPEYPLAIRRQDGTGFCPYSSGTAFFRNWALVREDANNEKTFSRKPRTGD